MLRVYACITTEHDLRLVVLAGLICLLSCLTAFSLGARVFHSVERLKSAWTWAASIVAGLGIFATHFLAMLAFRPGLPIGYDPALSILSALVAIFGIRVSQIAPGRGYRPIKGAVAGLAIGAMHYTGMAAIQVQAIQRWDPVMIAASIAVGVILCAVAMSIYLKRGWFYRPVAVLLATLAVCGLHFTAMAAIVLIPDASVPMPAHLVDPSWLAVAVAAVTVLIIVLGLGGSILDQHLAARSMQEARRLRVHVTELEAVKNDLEATSAQLADALGKAEQASQAKSQFLATMSHELRTPLNAIIGFSEILSKEAFGPLGGEHYQEYAETIRHSGVRLLAIISDVLEIVRLDTGQVMLEDEEIALLALLRQSTLAAQPAADQKGIAIVTEADRELPALRADPRRVRQMVDNLVSNAIKFSESGGTVRVAAFQRGDEICVSVEDRGIGVAAEDIPKIFRRFGQLDSGLARRYEGTGLGLPLTKQLVELHDGRIEFDSAPGAGTTATLVFPAARTIGARRAA